MNIRTIVLGVACSGLTLAAAVPNRALGQPPDSARASAKHAPHFGRHDVPGGELVETVRRATRPYGHLAVAQSEGYELHFGCVSGPDVGAMGLHYVNMALVGDGELDPERPEIVIYEPLPNGRVRLIGADFLVLADAWHANNAATPQLMGQLLHLIPSPNRYGLPDFYTLHVWAWKANANGTFVNWHPDVSCEAFDGGSY
jgi:hypothetical protein